MYHFSAVQVNSFFSLHIFRQITGLKSSLWCQQGFQGVTLLFTSQRTISTAQHSRAKTLLSCSNGADTITGYTAWICRATRSNQIKRSTDIMPQHLHPNKNNLCACSNTLIKLFSFWSYHLTARPGIVGLCLCAASIVLEGVTRQL